MSTLFCRLSFAVLLLPLFTQAQNFGGNPASQKWWQINSGNSRVIFPAGLDSQANRISNLVDMLDSATLYSIGTQNRKWNIVLLNQTTEANAYVRLAPVISELYMTPSQNNFSFGSLRWDDNLVIHENRHMQQLSNFNHGLTKVFSFFLGQEGQLFANGITIPNYFFEGDAVWQETLVSRQGRGRMPSFYNGMKSLWLAGKQYSWMQLRNGSLRKFVPDHYELGYPVLLYGYSKYGPDFWRKVTNDAVNFKGLFYSFNNAVKTYSGKSYSQFTKDALQFYREQTLGSESTIEDLPYFTKAAPNNVTDYLFPQFINDDSVVVTKRSFREPNSFYLLTNGTEKKIRVKDYTQDEYFSYGNGKVVYAAYESDPRWTNRNYSVIKLLDIHTGVQVQLTSQSKYFSPGINKSGTEVIAVTVNDDGSNALHRLDAGNGAVIKRLPNPGNYFFTQTRYIDDHTVVSAVRSPSGEMALVTVDLTTGAINELTPFIFNLLGYPAVKDGMVYFSMTDHFTNSREAKPADRVFAVSLGDKKIYRITNNVNGIYHPAVNSRKELMFTAATADGSRLVKSAFALNDEMVLPVLQKRISAPADDSSLQGKGANLLAVVSDQKKMVAKYRKSFQLLNFHSWRPFADDPEFGYTLYSDNILSNLHSELTYTYNRNEQSHGIGYNIVYGGLFPVLRAGAERIFNRKIGVTDSIGSILYNYHSTKLNAGFSIPLSFINGRTFKYFNIGAGYNSEYVPYRLVGKDVATKPLNYLNAFLVLSNTSRKTPQMINPAWAQSLTVTYRNATSLIDNHKLVADASFSFPGLLASHSLVIDGAFQKRDTLGDFFSNTYSFPRGYQELNQRRMYKLGVNYHFPLCYPDWGFGNIIFFQRVRVNAFYDYGRALTKFRDGTLVNLNTRSTGGELYFDSKIWNALPVSFGIRYSRLLDRDYLNPGAVNRWEIIVPIGVIPD